MSVYIPCLNPDVPDDGGGFSVGIGGGPTSGEGGGFAPGVSISHSDSPVALTIVPVPPFIIFGPNFQFWQNLFGLGETRIQREKAQIQDILTPIFQYLSRAYGVPIRDDHALQFPSDGVQKQFALRPDIEALVPEFLADQSVMCGIVFARTNCGSGEGERIVNQFLANAAYNQWPVNATRSIWQGIVDAANPNCRSVADRWLKNPEITYQAAVGGVLLQYIPLDVMLNMATRHALGSPILENLVKQWALTPSLVANIPQITGLPWQSIYTEGAWARPPYGDNFGNIIPLEQRDHILPIINTISVPYPRYPDFIGQGATQIPSPLPGGGTGQQGSGPPPDGIPVPVPQPGGGTGGQQGGGTGGQQPGPPPASINDWSVAHQQKACQIIRLLRGNSQLTPEENAFYTNTYYLPLFNDLLNSNQCRDPIVRQPQQPSTQPQPQPSGPPQPPPDADPVPQPNPRPVPQPPPAPTGQPQYTPQDADFACYIVRLLTGNSTLTAAEYNFLHDPRNATIIAWMRDNPQCQIPLQRQDPGGTPQPVPDNCYPIPNPQPLPSPVPQPNPQPNPQPIPDPHTQPCPDDCLHAIQQVRDRQQECCDEVHFNVIPRLDNLEHWVYDIERRVPGPQPELPNAYPIPPVDTVPGTDIPVPVPDDHNPVPPPATIEPTPETCAVILQCITEHCPEIVAILKACTPKDLSTDCEEGIAKWGKWAECWLNAKTPIPPLHQGFAESVIKSGQFGARLSAIYRGQYPGSLGEVRDLMTARIVSAWQGDFSQMGKPVFAYQGGKGYIFENIGSPDVIEIPPTT